MEALWIETITRQSYPIRMENGKGEVSTQCPVCSDARKPENKRKKCLSLNIDKGTGHCHNCNRSFYQPITGKEYPVILTERKIKTRPVNEAEHNYYWSQYGISKKILEVYEVCALDSYQLGKHKEATDPENPIFCYQACKNSYKIYRPYAQKGQNKFIWVGGKPENWYFGLNFCKGSNRVYLAAGEKDVLTLVSQGAEAFTLNSETAVIPEALANRIKNQYKEVIVLYDNDKTGAENSKKICREYGFIRAILPEGVKDVSDLIKTGRSIDEIIYQDSPGTDFFIVKSLDQWVEESKKTPPAPQLFGPFITKGELTLIFADPSAGKSVLSVQIGDNLCRGLPTMELKNESAPMKVLYIDFENSPKQIEKRYTDEQRSTYISTLLRAEINPNTEFDDNNLEEIIFSEIKNLADRLKTEFIIIDNLSWLHSEADKAKFAVPLMRKLKGMVKNQGLTVLVINHTVKRDESRAITANDMAGSKQLRALADMIFTIGVSAHNKNVRYLKMLKDSRTTGEIYGPDNVLVCELVKTDHIHFQYLTIGRENDYLPKPENRLYNPKDDQKITAKVLSAAGHSNIEISKLLKVSEGTIRNWLKTITKISREIDDSVN